MPRNFAASASAAAWLPELQHASRLRGSGVRRSCHAKVRPWHMCVLGLQGAYLCVTTPLAACSCDSCCTELKAPRNLNAPLQAAPNRPGQCWPQWQTHSCCGPTLLTLFGRFRT